MSDSSTKQPTNLQDQGRRRFIKGLSVLIGATATSQLVLDGAVDAALAYSPQADSAAKAGKILTKENLTALRDICSQVIPKTDTDGAAEVDTHGFIDNQLYHCHTKEQQQMVTDILARLDKVAQENHQAVFSALTFEQQLSLLMAVENSSNGFNDNDLANFKFLKSQIVFGYYTSEVGASQELTYLPVPGGFKGSIPYDSVGSSWGSMRSYF